MSEVPNQSIANNVVTPVTAEDAEMLFGKAIERTQRGGQGLTPQTVALMRTAAAGTGNALFRAAAGRIGQNLPMRQINHLILLLDGSGSMRGARDSVIAGVNDMVDDISGERNPLRDSFELTIWIFRQDGAELLKVTDPATGTEIEVANIPIRQMPHLTQKNYDPIGGTPLFKTMLAAMGAGSLRSERLRLGMGANGVGKASAMTYLIVVSDGANTLNQETVSSGVLYYRAGEVAQVSRDLLQTEQWVLAYGYAGTDSTAEAEAKAVGFPTYEDVDKVGGWRAFLGLVSRSVQAASKAASQGQSGSQVGGGFFTTP